MAVSQPLLFLRRPRLRRGFLPSFWEGLGVGSYPPPFPSSIIPSQVSFLSRSRFWRGSSSFVWLYHSHRFFSAGLASVAASRRILFFLCAVLASPPPSPPPTKKTGSIATRFSSVICPYVIMSVAYVAVSRPPISVLMLLYLFIIMFLCYYVFLLLCPFVLLSIRINPHIQPLRLKPVS